MANGPDFDAIDVFTQTRACLNDLSGETYLDTKLLTFFQMAWEDLELELTLNDLPMSLAKTVITIPAGTISLSYTTTPALPTNLWMPIALEESQVGANVWIPMRQRLFERPVAAADRPDNLILWSWHEGTIFFEGAKTARDIALFYFKALAEVLTSSTDLGRLIPFSRGFLSRKTAALTYALQKKDMESAQIMQDEAVNFMTRMVSVMVKQSQNMPVRRKAYRGGRRYGSRLRMG